MMYKAVSSLVFVLLPIGMLNADTLELKNGSVIKGSYVGGSDTTISFRVGSSVQQYSLADISSLKFDERESAAPARAPGFAERSPENAPSPALPLAKPWLDRDHSLIRSRHVYFSRSIAIYGRTQRHSNYYPHH